MKHVFSREDEGVEPISIDFEDGNLWLCQGDDLILVSSEVDAFVAAVDAIVTADLAEADWPATDALRYEAHSSFSGTVFATFAYASRAQAYAEACLINGYVVDTHTGERLP